jgi:hypothetical protein
MKNENNEGFLRLLPPPLGSAFIRIKKSEGRKPVNDVWKKKVY